MPAIDPPASDVPPDQASDHGRFLAQFLEIQTDLGAFVRCMVRDVALADDVVQEVALVLWRKYASYDPQRSAFGAWARGIASTEILRQRQRFSRRQPLIADAAAPALVEAWDRLPPTDARLEALQHCLGRLQDPAQRMLDLRYRQGLDLAGVATRLGRSREAVSKALQRVRTALAACIQRHLAGKAS